VLLAVGLSIPALLRAQMPEQAPEAVRGILQLQFEAGGDHETAGRTLLGSRLALFYQKRDYLPIWMTLDGLIPEADNLFEAVTNAERQGLDPGDYHLDALRQRLTGSSPKEMAELELLLTDAFLRYCLDLRSGRADPRKADPEWFVLIDRIDHLDAMENALAKGRFQSVLDLLAPRDPAYRRLLEALTDYRQMARQGGWPRLDVIGTLREGMTAAEIPVLRERLRRSGDLSSPDTNPFFDPPLTAAVRSFQSRHGLEVDGVVGPRTRAALNIPVEERLDAILLNIERWRWMPRELPDRYLLVNMAGFHLQAVERHRSVLEMRVIVGRDYRQTPAFSEPLRYLVVNPFWNIPPALQSRTSCHKFAKIPTTCDDRASAFSATGALAPGNSIRPRSTGGVGTSGVFPSNCARTPDHAMLWAALNSCCPIVSTFTCTTPPTDTCSRKTYGRSAQVAFA
jgi:murein L,D-transpeptidase YcbB/YkuD